MIICEYCDQGVHYSCLTPPPEKKPKVWTCDDCLIARGKPPNNNVKKRANAGLFGPPALGPPQAESNDIKAPTLSRFSNLLPPELHPRDKTTTDEGTMDDSDDSSSDDSSSDSEDTSLAPPKLAPVSNNLDTNAFFNDLLKDSKKDQNSIKEEASIEYSSNVSEEDDDEEENEPLKKPPTTKVQVQKKAKPTVRKTAAKNNKESSPLKKSKIFDSTTSATSEDEEMPEVKLEDDDKPLSTLKDSNQKESNVIPEDIRFDPAKNLENKPKGLVDSLTKYFTPGHKRTSRTALNSLLKPATELQTSPAPTPTTNSSTNSKKRKIDKIFSSSGTNLHRISRIRGKKFLIFPQLFFLARKKFREIEKL